MICAASLSKLLGDDIAARNKDSPKGKKAMESYTRLIAAQGEVLPYLA